ncbi:proteasome subunit beta type-2 [Galendromus occidentalis]|uniref:Proteasome subunit beta n=1 Tax=Galendromus occidentalis TaxID=34638 RepID=A0AAJ6QW11_9ACAR|nr:proteasome subunit beta type-2 [Galendromus occidentalis]
MESLIGIKCRDFVLLAADASVARSIMVLKQDEQKIFKLSDSLAMAVAGESGDTVQFADYIAKNIQLFKMRNGYGLSPKAAANFTRKNLADSLRTRNAYRCDLLLGGFDSHSKEPELYWVDYLGSLAKVPFAAHGYGGIFSMGVIDAAYRADMTVEEAHSLIRACVKEIRKRFLGNMPVFKCVVIDTNGIRDLSDVKVDE